MNDKRELAYFTASMVLLTLALMAGVAGDWQVFAPALIGAIGYWMAMAEVKS